MKTVKDYPEMPDVNSFPRISLILPFQAGMHRQGPLVNMLKVAAEKAEKELLAEYSEERAKPVIKKLHQLIAGIHCRKDNKTLCIFVSPQTEKVYYFKPTAKLPI